MKKIVAFLGGIFMAHPFLGIALAHEHVYAHMHVEETTLIKIKILGGFVVIALLIGVLFYFVKKKNAEESSKHLPEIEM